MAQPLYLSVILPVATVDGGHPNPRHPPAVAEC